MVTKGAKNCVMLKKIEVYLKTCIIGRPIHT